ncbi:MAG: tryptophan synthase subunit alpha [Nannocystaceae bacterium]|nr:tryptophan synthase subunit alpha [Myxococcales bacterium]
MTTDGRIARRFAALRAEGRAGLVGYLTAGDPDAAGARERAFAACEAGLDLLELGVPFSDPTADGPEIQEAMVRALAAGATLDAALELAAAIRARFELPIVLFGYANPLLRRPSPAELVAKIQASGVDGLLVVDLPPEHAAILRAPARAAGLDWIGLVAPTSTARRVRRVVDVTSGFLYAVSLVGVTGTALDPDDPALHEQLAALRARAALPVAVGFGVREPAHVRALAPHVDAVVVGSALVRAGRAGPAALAELVRALADATRPRPLSPPV